MNYKIAPNSLRFYPESLYPGTPSPHQKTDKRAKSNFIRLKNRVKEFIETKGFQDFLKTQSFTESKVRLTIFFKEKTIHVFDQNNKNLLFQSDQSLIEESSSILKLSKEIWSFSPPVLTQKFFCLHKFKPKASPHSVYATALNQHSVTISSSFPRQFQQLQSDQDQELKTLRIQRELLRQSLEKLQESLKQEKEEKKNFLKRDSKKIDSLTKEIANLEKKRQEAQRAKNDYFNKTRVALKSLQNTKKKQSARLKNLKSLNKELEIARSTLQKENEKQAHDLKKIQSIAERFYTLIKSRNEQNAVLLNQQETLISKLHSAELLSRKKEEQLLTLLTLFQRRCLTPIPTRPQSLKTKALPIVKKSSKTAPGSIVAQAIQLARKNSSLSRSKSDSIRLIESIERLDSDPVEKKSSSIIANAIHLAEKTKELPESSTETTEGFDIKQMQESAILKALTGPPDLEDPTLLLDRSRNPLYDPSHLPGLGLPVSGPNHLSNFGTSQQKAALVRMARKAIQGIESARSLFKRL